MKAVKEVTRTLKLGKTSLGKEVFGRPIYRAELELRLSYHEEERLSIDLEPVSAFWELAVTGLVSHNARPDDDGISACGQIVDDVVRLYPERIDLARIAAIWERWHLNDLKAGTREQTAALNSFWRGEEKNPLDWYDRSVAYLAEAKLLEDRGYRFGSQWLVEPLPEAVLREICGLFGVPLEEVGL